MPDLYYVKLSNSFPASVRHLLPSFIPLNMLYRQHIVGSLVNGQFLQKNDTLNSFILFKAIRAADMQLSNDIVLRAEWEMCDVFNTIFANYQNIMFAVTSRTGHSFR